MQEERERTRADTACRVRRALLIERDPLVRDALCALLRGWNFEVVAGSGPDRALRTESDMTRPDVAIIAGPRGDATVGVAWVAAVHACYGRLPTILIANQPAGGAAPQGCVRVDWPVPADRLRDAIAVVVSYETSSGASVTD